MRSTLSTPLQIHEDRNSKTKEVLYREVVDAKGESIVLVTPDKEGRRYAEQIVQAVNSHDELLAACTDKARQIEALFKQLSPLPPNDTNSICKSEAAIWLEKLATELRAAISKAREKTT